MPELLLDTGRFSAESVVRHRTRGNTRKGCGSVQTKVADERRRQILERARAAGRIAVTEIAEQLDVAPETVRRDFKTLEEHGLIRRTHGSAYPCLPGRWSSLRNQRVALARLEQARDSLVDAAASVTKEGLTPAQLAAQISSRSGWTNPSQRRSDRRRTHVLERRQGRIRMVARESWKLLRRPTRTPVSGVTEATAAVRVAARGSHPVSK